MHPSGVLAAWLTQPPGLVVQIVQPTALTADLARFISQDVYLRLEASMDRADRAFFIYDFRHLTRYETEARTILTQWAMRVRTRVERIVVLPPPEMQKIVRMGIHTVATMLSVAGIPMEVADDLEPFFRAHPLRPRL